MIFDLLLTLWSLEECCVGKKWQREMEKRKKGVCLYVCQSFQRLFSSKDSEHLQNIHLFLFPGLWLLQIDRAPVFSPWRSRSPPCSLEQNKKKHKLESQDNKKG